MLGLHTGSNLNSRNRLVVKGDADLNRSVVAVACACIGSSGKGQIAACRRLLPLGLSDGAGCRFLNRSGSNGSSGHTVDLAGLAV